jgi:polysaccharide biosynthesis protein PelC
VIRFLPRISVLLAAALLTACATGVQSVTSQEAVSPTDKWALLPLSNNTDTPQAALSAEAMVEHLLRLRGISALVQYPATLSRDSLFEPTERRVSDEAQKWALAQNVRFAVAGSVEEWRYKVGIDGEPAVGVTLKVIDLANGRVVWSASGAKSGWSREPLSGVAQKLLASLISGLPLSGAPHGTP